MEVATASWALRTPSPAAAAVRSTMVRSSANSRLSMASWTIDPSDWKTSLSPLSAMGAFPPGAQGVPDFLEWKVLFQQPL